MRKQYPLGLRQDMLRFSLPTNLEKGLGRLRHQAYDIKAVFTSRFEKLFGGVSESPESYFLVSG
jgi:hypothetical protein